MTRALHNAVGRISTALGLGTEFGGEAGDDLELGLGDPHELVPSALSGGAMALLRMTRRSKGLPPEWADEPPLVPRVMAEGERTARGRRFQAEASRVLEGHVAQLAATNGVCPWRTDPPLINLAPAGYGLLPGLGELRGRPTEG